MLEDYPGDFRDLKKASLILILDSTKQDNNEILVAKIRQKEEGEDDPVSFTIPKLIWLNMFNAGQKSKRKPNLSFLLF